LISSAAFLVLFGLPLALLLLTFGFTVAHERRHPRLGRMVEVAGEAVHVVERGRGDGPALLLIHGASGTAREPLEALGDALEGRYRLLSVDRPGHGLSTRRDSRLSDPRAQADLVAAALREMGVGRTIVLGHSLGAAVAASLGARHPDLIAGLVFVAPATHPWPGRLGGYHRLGAHPRFGPLVAGLVAVPLGLAVVPGAVRSIFAPNPVPERYRERIAAASVLRPRAFLANSRDVAGLKRNLIAASALYHRIRAPAEIVTGDADRIVSPAIHALGLVRDLGGAPLTLLAGHGHMPHWSARDAVVAATDRVAARAAAAGRREGARDEPAWAGDARPRRSRPAARA